MHRRTPGSCRTTGPCRSHKNPKDHVGPQDHGGTQDHGQPQDRGGPQDRVGPRVDVSSSRLEANAKRGAAPPQCAPGTSAQRPTKITAHWARRTTEDSATVLTEHVETRASAPRVSRRQRGNAAPTRTFHPFIHPLPHLTLCYHNLFMVFLSS